MTNSNPTNQISRKEAITLLWNRATLVWKLDSTQKELYNCYQNSTQKTSVWLCSRRLGKSFALSVIAIETCLKKANSIVKYVAPQTKMVRTIIRPILRDILKDCPPELRPEYKTQEQLYRFPNGSEIQLAGTDNQNAENIRGGGASLCIVDEAGFCDDLNYIVKSILLPTTTTTRGKIILSSTPPKSPGHDFVRYVEKVDIAGNLVKKTIYDNPRLSSQDIEDLKAEYGGDDSIEWRREFLCEMIVDEESAVIPEFTETLKTKIVREWIRPPHFDSYSSMDLGFKDLTVVLFAYFDFIAGKLIIEDELVMSGVKMTTDALAKAIVDKETLLWNGRPVYLRVSDNSNLMLLNDLQIKYKLTIIPTAKDNADAALNNMRVMLKQERIIISPNCKTLIRHIKNATWNNARSKYNRSAEDAHYDAIDALKYLARNVQTYKNPYPENFGIGSGDSVFYRDVSYKKEGHDKIKDLFKVKKSLRYNNK